MKTAIVTGGGTGIGRESAIALAKAGFAVAIAGRREEPLLDTAKIIKDAGGKVLAIPTDVANPASVSALFQKVIEQWGRLDVLFNNAGVNIPGDKLEDVPFENWQKVVDVNISGVFLCTQEAFRRMKAQSPQGGRIINNGSISAHIPRPNSAPYTASKHAVSGLTKAAGLDGRKYNIHVGQIDIGNALTDMAEKMTRGVPQADGSIKVEPTIDMKHVAEAVVYMASLPLDVNVPTITVMASQMPYLGRG